jgi:hypothetical protein
MRRRPLIIAAVGLAALAIAYTVYWFVLAGIVAQDIENWAALNRRQGYAISYTQPALSGFPWAVTARFVDPDIVAPGSRWRWRGAEVKLSVLPWAPFALQFSAPGRHRLFLGGAAAREIDVAAEWLTLDLHLKDGVAPDRFGFTIARALVDDSRLGMGMIEHLAAEARLPDPPAEDPSRSGLDLIADAKRLKLPESLEMALGNEIYHVHLITQVMGALPSGVSRSALAAWSASGGDVELRRIEIVWGGLFARGDGTLAFDKAMQPLFAGSFNVGNLGPTLERLAKDGMLSPATAEAAKLMFAALAVAPPGGGFAQVKIPLTIQEGFLYLGPIKVAALRALDWSRLP